MKIKIISVGKIKEIAFRDLIAQNIGSILKNHNIELIEIKDESIPNKYSEKLLEDLLEVEGNRIEKYIKREDYIIALAIEGEMIDEKQLEGLLKCNENVVFIIGGSLGISKKIKKKADKIVSFSRMTFTHQFMKVLLIDEINRIL